MVIDRERKSCGALVTLLFFLSYLTPNRKREKMGERLGL